MRVITEFPRPVREIEHVWIPLSDGTRLAARIWLPEDAEQNPVPGILEYLPYRKSDGTAVRDSVHHPYFAGHGYASIRVDMRGSGDSEGVLLDEYLPREQEDALEVLSWIAAQPWSTGKVGMYGKSWGGFNGLQVAAHQPPELKAVISLCATDDRYADDVRSVTFTSQPLEESLDILGFPEVSMRLSANRERALISVRLCEVFPDGTSALLSWGLLNLAHGETHEVVRYLKPNEILDVTVRLNAIGCRISGGNALRVSLSTAYWPQAWPSPEPVTLRLNGGCLRLPIWSGQALKAPYGEPEGAFELKHSVLRKSGQFPTGHWHAVDEKLIYEVLTDGGRLRFEDGLELDERAKDQWEIKMADPLSAIAKCERKIALVRGAWRVRVEMQSDMRCDESLFYLTNKVVVHEGEKAIFHRDWYSEIPREGC